MQELEKILEKIETSAVYAETKDGYGAMCVPIGAIEKIIRKHMNNGWIPVEERLPENEHSVLICGNPGWIDVGWFIRGVWRTGFSAAEIRNEVVAWRPLPDPYRPEREVSCDER